MDTSSVSKPVYANLSGVSQTSVRPTSKAQRCIPLQTTRASTPKRRKKRKRAFLTAWPNSPGGGGEGGAVRVNKEQPLSSPPNSTAKLGCCGCQRKSLARSLTIDYSDPW